jgi:signal transduction histidine kinase
MYDIAEKKLTYSNPGLIDMTRYNMVELNSILSDNPLLLVHPEDLVSATEKFRQFFNTSKMWFDLETRILIKEKGYRWLRNRINIVRDSNGKPLELIGTCRDITEYREMSKKLKQEQEKLLQLETERNEALNKAIEMKDKFLSNVTHELKTPLTVINSAIQAMKHICRDDLSDKSIGFLNSIQQSTNRQLKLVDNLLDITLINAGYNTMHKEYLDIEEFVRKVTESTRSYAMQKGIKLSFYSPIGEKFIVTDGPKLEKILLCLLSNAVKFTPKGETIEVSLSIKEAGSMDSVCIMVHDTGIGIPADKQEMIFEVFGQVDNSLSRQTEGTGIGLSLATMLTRIIGGEIKLESTFGEGSTFSVVLPAIEEQDSYPSSQICNSAGERLLKAAEIEFSDVYL